MSWAPILTALFAGFILGLAVSFLLRLVYANKAKELVGELFRETEALRKEDRDAVIENVKESFGSLSFDALSKCTEEFLKLAREKLESERQVGANKLDEKKGLIDQQLERMTTELENVSRLMKELEKDRIEKFGELATQLKTTREQTTALMQTTITIRETLASTKVRGQWGERMAEDVLRLAGFIENVNYLKQKAVKGAQSRPDFTFLLPRNLKLNMDVKFPLDNYARFIEADSESEKAKFSKEFLRNVKARIKEITNREYIDPEQNTLDYVLMFIPNEHIYAFIHEQDSSILEEGLRNRVVFCSPITLFAVLSVIRQAVDNFALEKTSNEMLSLFGRFKKQWGEFLVKLELLGKRIADAQNQYDVLTTTRRRQLEKSLNRIEDLRIQRGLPVVPEEDDNPLAIE